MTRLKTQKAGPKATPVQGLGEWSSHAGGYVVGMAHAEGVQNMASDMDIKWGVDRLRLLVDAELRAKFDRQRVRWNRAVVGDDLGTVEVEAKRMMAAYRALDKHATAAGHGPPTGEVWEVDLSDGRVLVFARTPVDAQAWADGGGQAGRRCEVWCVSEAARMIEAGGWVSDLKAVFPGAEVVASRAPRDSLRSWVDNGDPLDDIM